MSAMKKAKTGDSSAVSTPATQIGSGETPNARIRTKGPDSLRKGSKQIVHKLYLGSPYKPTWPEISETVISEIVQELDKYQCTPRPPRPPCRKRKRTESTIGDILMPTETPTPTPTPTTTATTTTSPTIAAVDVNNTDSRLIIPRVWIVSGINAVTKAMERDEILLMFVCKSGAELLTRHMLFLAHNKSVKICAFANLTNTLGKFIGAPSATAIGIRRKANTDDLSPDEENNMTQLKSFLLERATTSSASWIPVQKKGTELTATTIIRRGSAPKSKKKKKPKNPKK
eukprot:m.13919 g.13919  ORF g.13919 m.13919 type:complete len:286 (-) comp9923_c0_seq1:58-915(-)